MLSVLKTHIFTSVSENMIGLWENTPEGIRLSSSQVVTFMSSHIPRVDLSYQDKTFHAVLSAPPPLSFDLHWGAKVEKMGMLVTRWRI